MTPIVLDVPGEVLLALKVPPEEAGAALRMAAAVGPLLDQLQALRFRMAPHTRVAVLKLAGE